MKVRLEADNPGYLLRPEMFVDVELPVTLEAALSVPRDAVLDSGLRKTVFVDSGRQVFEPREIETGGASAIPSRSSAASNPASASSSRARS